jgi:hypothetical protein
MQKVATWDYNAVALLKAAYFAPFGLKRLFSDPIGTAAGFGFDLDRKFVPEIERLNATGFFASPNPEDEELADFLHTTIVDGRYLEEWLVNPSAVAGKLGITVSPAVFTRIKDLYTYLNPPPHQTAVTGTASGVQAPPSGVHATPIIYVEFYIVLSAKAPEYRADPSHLGRF